MKRQNSMLSSSSSQVEIFSDDLLRRSLRRKSKSFGCISGLLRFLSNNNRRNKSITFAHNHNQELNHPISPPSKPKSNSPQIPEQSTSGVSRFRGARGPIVRLMGLEESPTTATEERKKEVVDALEKCERDLKALKEFLDAFESSNSFRSIQEKKIEVILEEPSSYSVKTTTFFHCSSINPGRSIQLHQRQELERKKPGEGDVLINQRKFDKIKTHDEEIVGKNEKATELILSPLLCCSSKAIMGDSVEGVSKDIVWDQKREVGRIGLALQHQIFGELVEDLFQDFNFIYSRSYSSLPFEACKIRLCF